MGYKVCHHLVQNVLRSISKYWLKLEGVHKGPTSLVGVGSEEDKEIN